MWSQTSKKLITKTSEICVGYFSKNIILLHDLESIELIGRYNWRLILDPILRLFVLKLLKNAAFETSLFVVMFQNYFSIVSKKVWSKTSIEDRPVFPTEPIGLKWPIFSLKTKVRWIIIPKYQKAQYEFVDKVGNPDKLEVLFWHFGFFIDKIVAARLILLSEAISCAIKSWSSAFWLTILL